MSLLAWGAQFEAGEASSPIRTSGAPATRAADVLRLDWGRLGIGDGVRGFRYACASGAVRTVTASVTNGVTTMPAAGVDPVLCIDAI